MKLNELFQRSAASTYPPWQDLGDPRNSCAVGPSRFGEISDEITISRAFRLVESVFERVQCSPPAIPYCDSVHKHINTTIFVTKMIVAGIGKCPGMFCHQLSVPTPCCQIMNLQDSNWCTKHKGRTDASYKTPAPCPCWIIHSGFNVSFHAAMKREWDRFTPNTQIQ